MKLEYEVENIDEVNDGYHSFRELYHHRTILFSIVCKQNLNVSWRSKLHYDGTMYIDHFIVCIETPEGQYSFHPHIRYWENFDGIKEYNKAPKWDGHKPDDIGRLYSLLSGKPYEKPEVLAQSKSKIK